MVSRREFLKLSGITAGGLVLSSNGFIRVLADVAAPGLSNPADQPMFNYSVPDALAPGFIYKPDNKGKYKIKIGSAIQQTGLRANGTGPLLDTPIWGYGDQKDKLITWPGRTFQVNSVSNGGNPETEVIWANALDGVSQHLLPVDTNLHWCYSLHDYTKNSIAKDGVPIITHLHGGHTDYQFDGNPEFFYSPVGKGNKQVVGPQWDYVPGGFTTKFRYDNNVPAGNLWYHDHALGITRLNVYAGMAGFYFIRDNDDTGNPGNPLHLPAWPYEKAYAIQDRMFLATGELFYPAYPGDPAYEGFITDEGVTLLPPEFPDNPRNVPGFTGGGPTALAEFFGDHMVVNGVIWPYENVEPRNYRLHLLNGTDSRFMAIRLREVSAGVKTIPDNAPIVPFWVIGSDQGLTSETTEITDYLLSEPGSRYDIVVNFSGRNGKRIIMENIGGDDPFGGDIPGPQGFGETDRIMAFDVVLNIDDATDAAGLPSNTDIFAPGAISNMHIPNTNTVNRTRKVALFEGKDEFGRLQPLLGAYDEATSEWRAIPWHMPTTENPDLGATEIWEIYNFTGDAHPVHLHLVHFDVLSRSAMTFDADESPEGAQVIIQHNGALGMAPSISNVDVDAANLSPEPGYVENAPKDMVTALPEQVTRIKATFDKPGRYVWHCHILSHEDHEMMRVLHVGPGA